MIIGHANGSKEICGTVTSEQATALDIHLSCDGKVGNYIFINGTEDSKVSLCEISVYGK